MKSKKPPILKTAPRNVSIHRAVLDTVGDFLSALIVELIHYRFVKNDRKRVYLQIDWLHEKLPYISRAGLDKKLNKLVRDGHIIKTKGEGRHYHKCWYSPSTEMREACTGNGAKVYFNLDLAEKNLEASVVYAAIVNLLKLGDELTLNTQKLVEGSGLSIGKVRKAVNWLIKNKWIVARKTFGNKLIVSLFRNHRLNPAELKAYLTHQQPTESYPHFDQTEDEPTERNPHIE